LGNVRCQERRVGIGQCALVVHGQVRSWRWPSARGFEHHTLELLDAQQQELVVDLEVCLCERLALTILVLRDFLLLLFGQVFFLLLLSCDSTVGCRLAANTSNRLLSHDPIRDLLVSPQLPLTMNGILQGAPSFDLYCGLQRASSCRPIPLKDHDQAVVQ